MTLQQKNAIIYGGGGSLGGAIAKAFAHAGANVFVAGRTLEPLEKIVKEIKKSGGVAYAHSVDALDERQVMQHMDRVLSTDGSVDICMSLIDFQSIQDIPLADMNVEDFVRPIDIAMRAQIITSKVAAKIMMKQKSGAILSLTATPAGIGYPLTGGFAPACAAIECVSTNLASELGPHNIRVINIRSAGSPDSRVFKEAIDSHPELIKDVLNQMENDTMLKALPLMNDIANVAVFLASDLARMITGVTIDVTAGTTTALNHRVQRIEQSNVIHRTGIATKKNS